MSIQTTQQVWERSRTVGTDRLVLLAIADLCDMFGGGAFSTVDRLALKTGLHPRTVQRSFRTLESLGELQRAEGGAMRVTLP